MENKIFSIKKINWLQEKIKYVLSAFIVLLSVIIVFSPPVF